MTLNLPADSLGPKPTVKQMEVLQKMATPNATVRTWTGVRMDSHGAYIDYHTPGQTNHEKVNEGTIGKFYVWGWLEHVSGDFRGHDYVVTERGRKVIAKGITR